ncbi:BlaI/MecI/CopY family transcriptional regulator [Candidatus Uhrbacteria bacterium]|nr:BlaI/MecI/CopY family transcriptional regulator [Candidatus Uhrbacteria bacterium]
MTLHKVAQKKSKVLGGLEELVLEALWKIEEGTVREVVSALTRRRDLAYTTVMTVMNRMVEKGYLCRKELRSGRFLYRPCYKREEFYAKTSRVVFLELIRNFGAVAIAQFVDAVEEVDPKQLKALKERLHKF